MVWDVKFKYVATNGDNPEEDFQVFDTLIEAIDFSIEKNLAEGGGDETDGEDPGEGGRTDDASK